MNQPISPAELIITKAGTIYHLNLAPENIYDTVIAVGDPNRVAQVSGHFDEVDIRVVQREFVTHSGRYKGKPITVISTGIGTDNIEIFLTELDALVNIDFSTREPRSTRRKLRIVRIGTSGALQADIPIGTHLASEYGVGFDNLMQFYDLPQDDFEKEITTGLMADIGLSFLPYMVHCSEDLLRRVAFDMQIGNTITAPGFYAPQGRRLRIPIRYPKLLDDLQRYRHPETGFRLTNFEMETAGYYALCRLFGHDVLSVNAIIANRIRNQFLTDHHTVVDDLIIKVLDRL